MGNCLQCIYFKECQGKYLYQNELSHGTVICADSCYVLSADDMPALQPNNLPPPKFLHLRTDKDKYLTVKENKSE